jgi:glycosyltransferase involved in cell wall biosynthesis
MTGAASSPPAVAVISNSCPPYRVHFLQRVARELPQIRLYSLFTHQISNAAWGYDPPDEIGPVAFGPGESSDQQSDLKRALHEWRKGGRIIRWMRQHDVRAAMVHGYNSPGLLRIIRWCHRNGVACLLHADSNIKGDVATGWRALLKRRIVGGVIRSSCAVLPCGSLGAQYFQKYGATSDQIFLLPVEPDYRLIEQITVQNVDAARRQFELGPSRRRIVYSGRLVSFKRVDLLIDAFAAIARDRPDWDLLIIGDGPMFQTLQVRVPEALRSRVTWTGFIAEQAIVSALYRASDVLVLPSDFEPWALVINEAAAAGLAIVASDVVGAAPELIHDGHNGRIFPHGDIRQLVQCLLEVTEPSRIDEMKAASADVLKDWQGRADPVQGLRAALRHCGVLPHEPR